MPRPALARLLATLAVLSVAGMPLVACGGSDGPAAALDAAPGRADAAPPPAASPVSDLLGRLVDVEEAHDRLGYVDEHALAELGGPLAPAEIRRLVLGETGARRVADARPAVDVAAQLGSVTVLGAEAREREVIGASGDLADELASTTPSTSILAPETASALQSCLGDPAAEVLRGSAVLGPTSGIGVSVLHTEDRPAGVKMRICAAPHYVRDLHAVQERLEARFPDAAVQEDEIGEREIVSAVVAADGLDVAEIRELLSGGDTLLELAGLRS